MTTNSIGRPRKDIVDKEDLIVASRLMRSNNTLVSRSIRPNLPCFDDLNIQAFENRSDFLINFISLGVNTYTTRLKRAASMLWPDSYEKMIDKLSELDAFLLNSRFKQRPVDWMLANRLTFEPTCRQCKEKMTLRYENSTVRWQCQRTEPCKNYFMPVQRPSFFNTYENIALDKLLFSLYFWSICTPAEDVHDRLKISPGALDAIWTRLQNVCRTALEKVYPRHKLTNVSSPDEPPELIDLVSIKLNDLYVVCAKHPRSNLVRLGVHIPKVSRYSCADLAEPWFAHGAKIRIGEGKFMDLTRNRTDLNVTFVPRSQMIYRDGQFDRNSAFGYIICQLTHVFKDFQSKSISRERLKLILAEMQWRELYGITPIEAFNNIVNQISIYGDAADWYTEPSIAERENIPSKLNNHICQSLDGNEFVWTEKYYYATVKPIDSNGRVISTFTEPANPENPPLPDVRLRCHHCNGTMESFDFSNHMIKHVEHNRKEHERKEYLKRRLIQCKHCFKIFKREMISVHSCLFRSDLQLTRYGCRICCIMLNDRAEYLQHMRRYHFESETPYRCPCCRFASSFQRDIFIHFQEEHRHSMVVMCLFCLRSFTVVKPETMTKEKMEELSALIYNHFAEHYSVSKSYSCDSCCLCFLNRDQLWRHKRNHHNPLEIRDLSKIKVEPFIVTKTEEQHCVKAVPIELFIPNKSPNVTSEETPASDKQDPERLAGDWNHFNQTVRRTNAVGRDDSSSSDSDSDNIYADDDIVGSAESDTNDSFFSLPEDGSVRVRGGFEKYLDGGRAKMTISRQPVSLTQRPKNEITEFLTSERLVEIMFKLRRADGIVPNRSVILTPSGKPAKCGECKECITIGHFVSLIRCELCAHQTHCPQAAINHKKNKHELASKDSQVPEASADESGNGSKDSAECSSRDSGIGHQTDSQTALSNSNRNYQAPPPDVCPS